MAAIQVKNVSPQLHDQLRQRAKRDGRSLSEYILRVLERDLSTPTTREWLDRLRQDEPAPDIASEEIVTSIREGRSERDEQVLGGLADRN